MQNWSILKFAFTIKEFENDIRGISICMVIFPIHVYFINSSFLYSPFKSQGSALDPFQDGQLKGEGEGGVKGGGIHLEKCIIQDRTWMSIKTISIFFFFPRKLNVFENFSRISHDIISIIFWKFREPSFENFSRKAFSQECL